MNICNQSTKPREDTNDPPIKGHIYKTKLYSAINFGYYGIIVEDWKTKELSLHSLQTGEEWATSNRPFGEDTNTIWKDVTHKYCLKEIE